jgi:ferredoxin
MAYTLARAQLGEWLTQLAQNKALVAPVRDSQGHVAFAVVDDVAQIVTAPGVTDEGPKRWFYPASEELFRYSGAGATLRVYEKPAEAPDLVLFGVRPCDAVALTLADEFWACDEGDPYYARRRERSLVIALNCDTAVPECFCESITQAMGNPRGMDILVTPLPNDQYLLEDLTEKGQAALQMTAAMLGEGGEEAIAQRQALAAQVGEAQKRRLEAEGITEAIQGVFKDSAFWQQHTAACIGCGVCTFLCPTCTCFDVMDDAIAGTGFRYRCWDTCQFRQFCEEASGHDRRPQQWERQRQRISHKLWYSKERFNKLSCVGCGRCVKLCPVNIDITQIAADARAAATEKAEASA